MTDEKSEIPRRLPLGLGCVVSSNVESRKLLSAAVLPW